MQFQLLMISYDYNFFFFFFSVNNFPSFIAFVFIEGETSATREWMEFPARPYYLTVTLPTLQYFRLIARRDSARELSIYQNSSARGRAEDVDTLFAPLKADRVFRVDAWPHPADLWASKSFLSIRKTFYVPREVSRSAMNSSVNSSTSVIKIDNKNGSHTQNRG